MEENNKNQLMLILYKLLVDALFLLLLTFGFMIIGEAGVPGLISEHISFNFIIIAIFSDFAIIFWLKNKLGLNQKNPILEMGNKKFSKPISYTLSIISFALIALVIRNFSFYVVIVILIATFIIFYFLFDLLFNNK